MIPIRRPLPLLLATCLALPLLCFGCSDDTEQLRRLPEDVAALLREGEIGAALEYLHSDFTAQGLDRARIKQVFQYQQGSGPVQPWIAAVLLDEDEEGSEERRLTVLGILPRGDPKTAGPASLRPFRVDAVARLVDGEWLLLSARLQR